MVFIKNSLNFHKEVFEKIQLNIKFFLFLSFFYLMVDILKYYQPLITEGFKEGDVGFLQSLTNLLIGFVLLLGYLSYACLWNVYFKRNESITLKIKAFFSTLLNFRMYIVYFMLILSILLGISLGIRFIPEVNELITEIVSIFTSVENSELKDEDKLALVFESKKIIDIYNNISPFQIILAFTTFLVSVLMGYLSFLFALPLVIRDKSNKAFSSMKKSLISSLKNFPVLFLTVILVYILKSIIESYVVDLNYVNKIVPILFDSVLFFYIVIGLEKFILTNDKK